MLETKHVLIVIIITALIFTGFGFLAGKSFSSANAPLAAGFKSAGQTPASQGYNDGWQACQKRVLESGLLTGMPADMPVMNLSGEIGAINGQKITLKIRPFSPFDDSNLDTREIIVGTDTKIIKNKPKDRAVYQKEMDEFQKKMAARDQARAAALAKNVPWQEDEPLLWPQPTEPEIISLKDLQVGDTINVSSEKDLRSEKTITPLGIALNISFNYGPGASMVVPNPEPFMEENKEEAQMGEEEPLAPSAE